MTDSNAEARLQALENALQVLVKDKKIRRFLQDHDPKALEQVEKALGIEPKTPNLRRLRTTLKQMASYAEEAQEVLQTRNRDVERISDIMDIIEDRIATVRDAVGDILAWKE